MILTETISGVGDLVAVARSANEMSGLISQYGGDIHVGYVE